jgi:hypothetical protein
MEGAGAAGRRAPAENCSGGQSACHTPRACWVEGRWSPGCRWPRQVSRGGGGGGGVSGARALGWPGGGGCVERQRSRGPQGRVCLSRRILRHCSGTRAGTHCSRRMGGNSSGSSGIIHLGIHRHIEMLNHRSIKW